MSLSSHNCVACNGSKYFQALSTQQATCVSDRLGEIAKVVAKNLLLEYTVYVHFHRSIPSSAIPAANAIPKQ
jgi:hypothetical protein